jgi:hypothetical protein
MTVAEYVVSSDIVFRLAAGLLDAANGSASPQEDDPLSARVFQANF